MPTATILKDSNHESKRTNDSSARGAARALLLDSTPYRLQDQDGTPGNRRQAAKEVERGTLGASRLEERKRDNHFKVTLPERPEGTKQVERPERVKTF